MKGKRHRRNLVFRLRSRGQPSVPPSGGVGGRPNCLLGVGLEIYKGRVDNHEMPAKTKRSRSPMSDSHKAALAEGREQGRAVRRYLEALEAHKPKRGRKRTPESVQKRLAAIEEKLAGADALTRLHLMQEKMNLTNELAVSDNTVDMQALEDEFVAAAAPYGARKGITYAAWRQMGVDPAVLRRANIKRGGDG
ncbi:MAG TPA: hypothetical protein VNT52_07930 [Acidimicrobiales bacterium]|nr:hypothetical protein [Acidimicrobiales bacterium]